MQWPALSVKRETLIGGAFLLSVVWALIYSAWHISLWLEDEQQVPVQRIVVTGKRSHIDDQQLVTMIRRQHPGSFFELDVSAVHQDLEAQPWVYRASVRKRWPNTLTVYVVEQQAVASWNSDMLLNQYGDSFEAQLEVGQLPALFGPGGSERTALEGYRAMQLLLNSAGLTISELTLSERFAWELRLNNGVQLNLGRSEFVDRLQRFVDLYPLLAKSERQVAYVDLRYDTGMAVGWKSEQQQDERSES
ncbi:cell division protein FtsQ/DivIB [Aestuariibacter halophilus]|uniref:Cell division protein FtsQ n=1 Tax=Fluctibacter halophilus TaxID=226011 RepID=A0ABS8G9G7_9ALTE|nr:cell division protein FtsQ/DivIB [Aestuariibacter halophilus]MCC2616455.1 cell division protein FtsQ/DivIB [Aestuariibacter halophilus]